MSAIEGIDECLINRRIMRTLVMRPIQLCLCLTADETVKEAAARAVGKGRVLAAGLRHICQYADIEALGAGSSTHCVDVSLRRRWIPEKEPEALAISIEAAHGKRAFAVGALLCWRAASDDGPLVISGRWPCCDHPVWAVR